MKRSGQSGRKRGLTANSIVRVQVKYTVNNDSYPENYYQVPASDLYFAG